MCVKFMISQIPSSAGLWSSFYLAEIGRLSGFSIWSWWNIHCTVRALVVPENSLPGDLIWNVVQKSFAIRIPLGVERLLFSFNVIGGSGDIIFLQFRRNWSVRRDVWSDPDVLQGFFCYSHLMAHDWKIKENFYFDRFLLFLSNGGRLHLVVVPFPFPQRRSWGRDSSAWQTCAGRVC